MMDELQRVIEMLENEIKVLNNAPVHVNKLRDVVDAVWARKMAIYSMRELQRYKQIGIMKDPISALQELFQYRKIGTLNECEEARRKQETMMIFRNVARQYNCPECGERILTNQKYCGKCGQAVKCIKEGWQRWCER